MDFDHKSPIIILIAIFFVFASLYSTKIMIVVACIAVVYMVWFASPERHVVSVNRFVAADTQLVQILANMKESMQKVPFDYEMIRDKSLLFLEEYMMCFADPYEATLNFERLVSARKNIVNDVLTLDVAGTEVPKATVDALSASLLKYVNALVLKYDFDSGAGAAGANAPYAKNMYGATDVF